MRIILKGERDVVKWRGTGEEEEFQRPGNKDTASDGRAATFGDDLELADCKEPG